MTSLISISDLIHESWVFFKNDWKAIVKRNAWMVLVMVAFYPLYMGGIAMESSLMILLSVLVFCVGILFVTLHAMRYILAKDGGQIAQATQGKTLSQLFVPTFLITLLSWLAGMGGMVLFIIPGIWFIIAAGQAIAVYLEEGTTGTNAIARSIDLVKGRWWKTLWRTIFPALVFQIIIGIISFAIYIVPIVFAIIGGAAAIMGFSEGGSTGLSAASLPMLIIAGLLFIVATVANLLLSLVGTGLSQVVSAKLFHSLKASR